jgi:hypothetical protein
MVGPERTSNRAVMDEVRDELSIVITRPQQILSMAGFFEAAFIGIIRALGA